LNKEADWMILESLEKDEGLEEKSEIDRVLAFLCFLAFAFIGYFLVHYLPF
jgi:hypothetical protein